MATSVKTMFEVAEERAELRAEIRTEIRITRRNILRGKLRGLSTDDLVAVSDLPIEEVEKILMGYDQTLEMWQKKDFEHKTIEHLSLDEVNYLLELFDKKR